MPKPYPSEFRDDVVRVALKVASKTNEITAFTSLLDTLTGLDLTGVVITADALRTQREHAADRHARGTHWVLTVKGNQPRLRRQLAGLPWHEIQPDHRSARTAHGRREIRTIKVVTIAAGIEFPTPPQYCRSPARPAPETDGRASAAGGTPKPSTRSPTWDRTKPTPTNSPPGSADTGRSKTASTGSATSPFAEDLSQVRIGAGPQVMASQRNLVISLHRLAGATNIVAALRHHARYALPPLQLLTII